MWNDVRGKGCVYMCMYLVFMIYSLVFYSFSLRIDMVAGVTGITRWMWQYLPLILQLKWRKQNRLLFYKMDCVSKQKIIIKSGFSCFDDYRYAFISNGILNFYCDDGFKRCLQKFCLKEWKLSAHVKSNNECMSVILVFRFLNLLIWKASNFEPVEIGIH